jgi:hypothetical protein
MAESGTPPSKSVTLRRRALLLLRLGSPSVGARREARTERRECLSRPQQQPRHGVTGRSRPRGVPEFSRHPRRRQSTAPVGHERESATQAALSEAVLLDECECARRPDPVLRYASLSSAAIASSVFATPRCCLGSAHLPAPVTSDDERVASAGERASRGARIPRPLVIVRLDSANAGRQAPAPASMR